MSHTYDSSNSWLIHDSYMTHTWLIHDSYMTHFRGYQDFAIEPHYEKLGEVNMQSEIARRQKLKQGNNQWPLIIWPVMTFRDLKWPHVTSCDLVLSVHFVWSQQNSWKSIWIICYPKNGIKIKDLMIWWMVSVKKERNRSEREKDFGQ